jgi:hypothetical protein
VLDWLLESSVRASKLSDADIVELRIAELQLAEAYPDNLGERCGGCAWQ